ncbi:AAA family ATPase [Streptacidiphilus sp. PB12-B1b]|nr:AAA family ATPase [Streptacidiphilus sp. PB12-B1b]
MYGRGADEGGLYERAELTEQAERALTRLCEGFRASDTNLGRVLLYSGAAGLGKTAIVGELRRSASARSDACLILSARGGEQQQKSPFHVVRQLLQPFLVGLGEAETRELLESWYDVAAPALGLVPASAMQTVQAEPQPQGVNQALDWLLTQLAVRRGPLVVIVDDLHWADRESLDWLVGFSGRLPGLPVLLALAFRPEELKDSARPLLALGENGSGSGPDARLGVQLQLRTLGPNSVENLIRKELAADADDLFCRESWSITGGNPFDVVALISKMKDRKLQPVDENVSELRGLVAAGRGLGISRRLEALGPDTTRFAYAAAVLDTEIDPDIAGRMAVLTPAAQRTAVERLCEERILRVDHDARGRTVLEFVHPTIGTAVYQTMLLSSIRTSLHGKAAAEVIAAGQSMAIASRHLLEIYPEDDLEVVRQLREAAIEHMAMGAPDAARRCLERALSEPPAEEDRADVLFELGRSALLTDPQATINHLRQALTAVPGLSPERREEATLRLGQALAHSNRMVEAAEVTADEINRTPQGPGRIRLQAAYYMWRAFLRDASDGAECSERLAELSGQLSADLHGTADAGPRAVKVVQAWDLVMRGADSAEALALAEHAFENGRLIDGLGWTNTTWGFEIPILLGLTYVYNDRLDLASRLSNEGARSIELAGWSGGHQAFVSFLGGLVLQRWGRLVEAEALLRTTLRRSDRLGRNTPLQWDIVGVLIDTLLARGRTDQALELAAEYHFEAPYPPVMVLPDAPTLHARLLLAQGRRDEAAEELRATGEALEQRGWHNSVWAPWAGHLAAAIAQEQPERARELAAQGLADARRTGTNSAVGSALRLCAAVADPADAPDLLRQAVDRLGKSPAAYEYALALVDQGAALRRVSRPREAIAPLEQGVELAAQCGADALAARGRAELVASGASPHRLHAVAARVLNREERQAAVLAAQRVPIEQIADRLGVSVGVASALLASAHRKVGTGPEGLSAALELGEQPGE